MMSIPATICGNSPFVKVQFHEKELLFLVDSGAYGCLINQKYVDLPDDKQIKQSILTGLGDTEAVGKDVMLFFTIESKLFCCPFTAVDLGNTFAQIEKKVGEVAGIIGGEFLNSYEVAIDYHKKELCLDEAKRNCLVEEGLKYLKEQQNTMLI